MKSKLFLTGIVVAILPALLACSSSKPIETVQRMVSCDAFTENNHPTGEVEIEVGGKLTVILCSNPATGFKWPESAGISNQTVLGQTGHEFVIVSDAEDEMEPDGKDEWTFTALEIGTSEITMEYSQPGEGGEKAKWSFTLTVVVK